MHSSTKEGVRGDAGGVKGGSHTFLTQKKKQNFILASCTFHFTSIQILVDAALGPLGNTIPRSINYSRKGGGRLYFISLNIICLNV